MALVGNTLRASETKLVISSDCYQEWPLGSHFLMNININGKKVMQTRIVLDCRSKRQRSKT